jgi:hypothetical protein
MLLQMPMFNVETESLKGNFKAQNFAGGRLLHESWLL